jgi:hypothetical protein
VDDAFGGNNASLNLRFPLMPRLPSATDLSPVFYTILIFDPVNQVARLHHLAVFVELENAVRSTVRWLPYVFCLNCLSCLSQNGRIGGEPWAVPSVCKAHSDAD